MNEDIQTILDNLRQLQEDMNEIQQDLEDLIDATVELQFELNTSED